jgi:ribulose-phosphate 3-epimerase
MEVLPAINCNDFECVRSKIEISSTFAKWVHIDIVDGKFASNLTWGSPEELTKLIAEYPGLKFEIHLMVTDPETQTDIWLRAGAKRVIVHLEAMTDPVYILQKCKKYNAEAMLAIGPKTEVERLLAHKDDFNYFQILAVYPGLAGQKFQDEALAKISFLRSHLSRAHIEVDGGVNNETIARIKAAGADMVVAASFIFESENPEAAYQKLQEA